MFGHEVIISGAGVGGLTAACVFAARRRSGGFGARPHWAGRRRHSSAAQRHESFQALGWMMRWPISPFAKHWKRAWDNRGWNCSTFRWQMPPLTVGGALSAYSPCRLHRRFAGGPARQSPDALHLGAEIVGFQQTANAVSAQLADGRHINGDVLIGSDGIHSPIRAAMLGDDKPVFTGNVAWRAVVPMEKLGNLAPRPTACVWMGRASTASPIVYGAANWPILSVWSSAMTGRLSLGMSAAQRQKPLPILTAGTRQSPAF